MNVKHSTGKAKIEIQSDNCCNVNNCMHSWKKRDMYKMTASVFIYLSIEFCCWTKCDVCLTNIWGILSAYVWWHWVFFDLYLEICLPTLCILIVGFKPGRCSFTPVTKKNGSIIQSHLHFIFILKSAYNDFWIWNISFSSNM